jgi:hypothetical protein
MELCREECTKLSDVQHLMLTETICQELLPRRLASRDELFFQNASYITCSKSTPRQAGSCRKGLAPLRILLQRERGWAQAMGGRVRGRGPVRGGVVGRSEESARRSLLMYEVCQFPLPAKTYEASRYGARAGDQDDRSSDPRAGRRRLHVRSDLRRRWHHCKGKGRGAV